MQNNRWLQALVVLLVIIASAWLAGQLWLFVIQFANVILLFFLSWLLAFILRPLARWLTARGLPFTLSVIIVYLALAIAFTVGGFLLVPLISQQISDLIANFDQNVRQIAGLVDDGQKVLISWGVKEVDLNKFYSDLAGQVQGAALSVLQNTVSILQSIATIALQFILVFLLSFYFMKDGERIFGGMLHLLPPRWRDEVRLVALSIEKSFGAFVRGQLVFALVYALLTAIVMLMPPFQLNYVVIASIVAGFCMVIPLVGNFLAFVPPMLVLIVTPDKAPMWLWFLLALFVMQSIMMNFLGPRIMSSAIGIHPLFVMAAILIGGQVAGLWGALFGIPVAGALNLVGRPLMRRVRYQIPLYQEVQPSAVKTSSFLTGPLAVQMAERSSTVVAEAAPTVPERPTQPHAVVELDDLDDDLIVPRPPTLSARLVRMVVFVGSRAVSWVWTRTHARAPRQ
ncbi:MAG TPA: AI-2E family transporter [Chloroflexia bacterium]|nr:AI-2E family transporter [Chloroflexia bacterium]